MKLRLLLFSVLLVTGLASAQVNLPRWGQVTKPRICPAFGCGPLHFRWASVTAATEPSLGGTGADLHLEFPIYNRSLPNRAQIEATLVYDSLFWGVSGGAWQPEPGGGWWLRTSAGKLVRTENIQYAVCGWDDGSGNNNGGGNIYEFNFSVAEPDGSLASAGTVMESSPPHGTHTEGEYWDCPGGDALPESLNTSDGKGFSVTVSGTYANVAGVAYDGYGDTVTDGLTDPNGNSMSASSSALTDALGTAVTVAGAGTPSSPITYTYTGPNNSPETITVLYESAYMTANFGCYANWGGNVNVPEAIEYPDGSTYTFSYASNGFLSSVAQPSGGTIYYTGWYLGVTCNPTLYITNGYGEYNSIDGSGRQWTWAFNSSNGQNQQVDPLGENTVFTTDSGGNLIEEDHYQGAWNNSFRISKITNSGTVYSRTSVTALCSPSDPTDPCGSTDHTQLQSSSTVNLDGYGFVTSTSATDWGVGAPPATPLRQTVNTYNLIGNGEVPDTTKLEDGSGTQQALTTWSYSGTVNPVSETSYYNASSGLTTSFTWNSNGTLHAATAPTGAVATFGYTCGSGFFPNSVQTVLGTTTSTWDCNGGVETGATDLNGHTSSATYDSRWRQLTKTNAEGDVTNFTWPLPSNGFQVTEVATTVSGSTSDALTYSDALGRPIVQQRRQAPGSSNFDSVQTTYDLMGRPSTVSMPYVATAVGQLAPAGTAFTKTSYDALSRATKVVDGGTGETDYAYNQNDVLSTVQGAGSTAPSVSRQEQFDGLGRLASVCEITAGSGIGNNWPSGNCGQTNNAGNGYLTAYTRNALGQITGVTQNAQGSVKEARSYQFDQLGRLTQEVNPETKGIAVNYTYDTDSSCGTSAADMGGMVKRVNARGIVTCYLHKPDGSGRLDHVTYSDGTPAKSFVYATTNPQAVEGYSAQNAVGQLVEAATADGTDEVFGFDAMGRPTLNAQKSPHSFGWYTATASWYFNGVASGLGLSDGNGNLIPGGQVTYSADGEGRPSYAADPGEVLVSAVGYTPLGLQSLTYGSSDHHADTDTYSFDADTGRMTGYSFAVNGATDAGTYNWLTNGGLGSFTVADSVAGTADNGFGCSYSHDDMGRLSQSNCGAPSNLTLTFDPFGNVCKSANSGTSFCPVYDAYNRESGANYDLDGDLLTDPVSGAANAFDAEGRPTTFINQAVVYDALGRAVEGAGHEFVYAPGGAKVAVMSGQALVRADVPLPGGAEAVYNAGGFAYYRHTDMLGSSRLATTYAGSLFSSAAFAPYGEPLLEAGAKDRSFTGQKQDIASGGGGTDANGQYDFLARQYSPTQSRWWTPDPAGLATVDPKNPQSWNRFAYVNGKPLSQTDADGLCGNVVIGGSTQTPGTPDVLEQTLFANSIRADLAFPFAGQDVVGSIASVEGAASGVINLAVLTAARAIVDTAALGGQFTVYEFSGGAQAAQTALRLLPTSISSRAKIVGISPGFGFGLFSLSPREDLTVGGFGAENFGTDLTAIGNGLNAGPAFPTSCSHNANCEFLQAGAALRAAASPSCGQKIKPPFTPSLGPGGGLPVGDLSFWGITGNFIDIFFLRWSVSTWQQFGSVK